MRQNLIIVSLAGSFGIFTLTSELLHHALMFVLFGLLPGHTEPLPASTMLVLWTLLFSGISASWLSPRLSRLYASFRSDRQDQTA